MSHKPSKTYQLRRHRLKSHWRGDDRHHPALAAFAKRRRIADSQFSGRLPGAGAVSDEAFDMAPLPYPRELERPSLAEQLETLMMDGRLSL